MVHKKIICLAIVLCSLIGYGQSVEYFWDTDPGFGKGTSLGSGSNINATIPLTGLTTGVHSLYVRGKNANGWGLYTKRNVYIVSGNGNTPNISRLEYFWDTDPGFGKAIPLTISSQTGTIENNFLVSLKNLSVGVHSLYIRAKDQFGKWSLQTKRNVYVVKGDGTLPDITEVEYYFDTDPGFGAGTSLPLTANNTIDKDYIIPLNNLTGGEHQLYIRAKDEFGKWSLYSQNTITIGDWNCAYNDAPAGHYAHEAVTNLCTKEILDNDGMCEPNETLNRAELAKITYLSIGLQNNPTADDFPSPFNDLQSKEDTWYYSYAKNLSYLEFDDATAPFDRNYFNFKPSDDISLANTLKVLLEAWNIDETNNSGTTPFIDEGLTEHYGYNYIVKAYDLGLISDTADHLIHPDGYIKRGTAFVILHKMLETLTPPTISDTDFFIPGNYTPTNLASFAGMHSGNFNHYTKTSFAIGSVGIPLGFEHTYNSYLSEMPTSLIPLQPLGKMWNHTYNSYITEIVGDVKRPDDYRVIVALPNSGFHIYQRDGGGFKAVTQGVYNTLQRPTADKFTIITKNQIVYTYQKFEGTDEIFPFVLTRIQDRNGNTLAVNYEDAKNPKTENYKRISEVVGTSGRKLQFAYHPTSDLVKDITDPSGRKISFTFNSDDEPKLISFTDAKNQSSTYNYGADAEKDLLMTITLPKGNTVTNSYEGKKLISSQTNANQPTQYTYDRNYGQTANDNFTKTTVVDPNNQTTVVDYNKNGNPNHIKKDNNTNVDITYDATQTHKPSGIDVNGKKAGLTYDDMGNVLSVNLPLGVSYSYEYNSRNDITKYTDANGKNYTYSYNGSGNLTQTSTPRGSTNFTVNSKGLVTSVTNPAGITTSYTYDAYGNVIKTDAPEGISTKASYDVISRLLSFTNPNGQSMSYQYDANDNLLEETFNNKSTKYNFDPNDNLTKIINANNGATTMAYDFDNDFLTSVNFGSATDAYTYFDDGKVKTYTNPKGTVFTYNYDSEGRLSSVSTTGDTVTYTYDTHNNITAIANSKGTISYTYDALNRVTSTIDYFMNTVGYSYDPNSNVTKITYPDNKVVNYTYYDDNLLNTVTDWNGNTTTYTYRADGLLNGITYANGTNCTYTYDNAGRMTGLSWKKADTTIINAYAFTLDPIGNHLTETKTEPYTASALANTDVSYSYNATNQIQNAGNVTFSHDTNGNITSKTGSTYTFDVYDRLTGVSGGITAQYEYDASGKRRKSTVNSVEKRYVLDILGMSRVLIETDNANTPQNYYVYGLGLISRTNASNQTHYYHYDFRGSTIAMTDKNEAITHKYQYNDFGQLLESDEADTNAYRYVGKYGVAFEDTELYFMRARFYDPTTGRFLSEDPIWATNLYPYAENNPIGNIDPKGEKALHGAVFGSASTAILESPKLIKNVTLGITGISAGFYSIITNDEEMFIASMIAMDDAGDGLVEYSKNVTKSGVKGAISGKLTSGMGFSSKGGLGTTKLFGKTGYLPIGVDFRMVEGRAIKDIGHLVYEGAKNELTDFIEDQLKNKVLQK
ncbi:RHS repeat-associated core domain-containing protein [uncultured Polaribacter sp.]|uniref:RHS repeat-associated core domain-containing protein n=1 Tax=uncultured Polaribacter sp. TaxID=174711 RepID=UPI002625A85A|nr:RHS repeat-associated core domain-containing protein [uncultured Polaribacter sp.]